MGKAVSVGKAMTMIEQNNYRTTMGGLYATGPVTFSNKNGKMKHNDHGWGSLNVRKTYDKHQLPPSLVNVQNQMRTYRNTSIHKTE